MKISRRKFIHQATIASGVFLTPSFIGSPGFKEKSEKVILFQGDSITDAGRNKDNETYNRADSLGHGYAFLAASQLLEAYPKENLKIYNRGISGNKVYQLRERWEKDCIELQPDVLSILIGVNDFWHTLSHDYKGTVEVYEDDFRSLLDYTLRKLPEVKLIIGEPFTVKGGKAITDEWYPEFNRYQTAAANIAKDYKAKLIPYQEIFDKALKQAPVSYWAPDGVHPSMAGAELMADEWITAYNSIY